MRLAVLTDAFPELSETFVAAEVRALRELGHDARVEAGRRAERPNPEAGGLPVAFLADDGPARQLAALAWLAARHPLRCLADLRDRRRWAREERVRPLRSLAPAALRAARRRDRHLHAHFAAGAALDAMRLARLLGVPWSLTAHAYDIYLERRNLREKLERAAFVTSGCEYTVRDLRALAGPAAAGRVHEVVMGVDGEAFRRRAPGPGDRTVEAHAPGGRTVEAHAPGRTVVAVGRLVEKKGFAHLVEAAALLRDRAPLDRVRIAGDGPLRGDLERLARERGVGDAVELLGPLAPDAVRDLLEAADLLAMPCVVAADGDRDSMPVAVKEALAMEVPVVASDEVGLPELVRPGWGRLVPPGDPAALAGAIEELLALPAAERAAMGRAGREHVLRRCDVRAETARLARLIEAAAAVPAGARSGGTGP
ncbi:MAG TPA: glycosyltransferase [Thermoleophilaceae bacterium]